ncbi:hypothetical protein [Arthrobacter sp. CAN_A1]|uniref:hypothetical protein n=1 Tax=Arthrobacter sp. CAN_A1 TaxID=2787717 RepID=UPI0018C8DA95
MKRTIRMAAAIAVGSSMALTGCGQQTVSPNLPAFATIDDAYDAVDRVLDCEPDPAGLPIVPMGDGVELTSDQILCAEHLQIDLYPDGDSLQQSHDIWATSHQGAVHLVRGGNWMVVDVSEAAVGEPSARDFEALAEELGGQHLVVGSN